MDSLHAAERILPLLAGGDGAGLAALFAGEPLIDDPRHGRVAGGGLAAYAAAWGAWARERSGRAEPLRLTLGAGRAVAEALLRLEQAGQSIALPVAVAADLAPGGGLAWARLYHSLWPLTGGHAVRPPLLPARHDLPVPDVVGRYQAALAAGDLAGIVALFAPGGAAREPSGGAFSYQGPDGLRRFYGALFANEGGIPLEHCALTDDGVCCAIEYNVTQWGRVLLPPQAGVAVYERAPGGLLRSARIYDDVDPPLMYGA